MKLITFDQDQQLRDYENFRKRDVKKIMINETNICYDIINIIVNFSVPEANFKPGANLSGINLVGYIFNVEKKKGFTKRGFEFIYEIGLCKINLSDANLSYSDFRNVIVTTSVFVRSNFTSAICHNSIFIISNFNYSKFINSDLSECQIKSCNLKNAKIQTIKLRFTSIVNSNLINASLYTGYRLYDTRNSITNDLVFHKTNPDTIYSESEVSEQAQ